jgi:hypothetical protein
MPQPGQGPCWPSFRVLENSSVVQATAHRMSLPPLCDEVKVWKWKPETEGNQARQASTIMSSGLCIVLVSLYSIDALRDNDTVRCSRAAP